MLKRQHLGCLLVLAMALTACGGGGGSGSEPAYRLSFAPGTLTASYEHGAYPQALSVTATLDRAVSQTVNVAVVDSVGVIEPYMQLSAGTGYSYQATVTPKGSLAAGEYAGSLQIKLCFDNPATCNSPLPGSPFSLPYKFTVTTPPVATVNPTRLSVDTYQEDAYSLTLKAYLLNSLTFTQIVDKTGVFQPNPPKIVNGPQVTATLSLNTTLAPGNYAGNVELRVCKDQSCTQEVAGSPILVPYTVAVKPATNLTPLVRAASVGEWAQYQANAAHTGYLPMTLDPTKFNQRWRWNVPGSPQMIQPVVTSNGTVYALPASSSQNATLYALSEHDKSVRWKKDFTANAANAPSTDSGMVYLATSGHQDTYMWSLDGSTGAINYRTAFSSQWQHYMAPAIANGAVYTNGGSVGGMLSFKAGTGEQNWFISLSEEDLWTPAVDGRYAYVPMGSAVKAVSLTTGKGEFDISDPAGTSFRMYGAPMIIGPSNVIMMSGDTRLINFDIAGRSVKWSIPGSFSMRPAYAKGVIYVANGAQLEARSEVDGSRLWSWAPDEATADPFRDEYNLYQAGRNIVVTDNLVFVSSATKVYAVSLATHQPVWSFPKPGRLALSPNGLLYINVTTVDPNTGLYAINLN